MNSIIFHFQGFGLKNVKNKMCRQKTYHWSLSVQLYHQYLYVYIDTSILYISLLLCFSLSQIFITVLSLRHVSGNSYVPLSFVMHNTKQLHN